MKTVGIKQLGQMCNMQLSCKLKGGNDLQINGDQNQ